MHILHCVLLWEFQVPLLPLTKSFLMLGKHSGFVKRIILTVVLGVRRNAAKQRRNILGKFMKIRKLHKGFFVHIQ